jgi:hypothetical protein
MQVSINVSLIDDVQGDAVEDNILVSDIQLVFTTAV